MSSRPAWQRAKDATRAPRFRDDADSTVHSSPACAFCAALDAAHEPGQLAVLIELAAIERAHGACTCGIV